MITLTADFDSSDDVSYGISVVQEQEQAGKEAEMARTKQAEEDRKRAALQETERKQLEEQERKVAAAKSLGKTSSKKNKKNRSEFTHCFGAMSPSLLIPFDLSMAGIRRRGCTQSCRADAAGQTGGRSD